eukprot:GEZU01014492.1.p1 GENE.GEZU01014492.1~~GEZU01014492.1.p1  ORF type:complete len:431 (-),score=133.09 GEZU01014492.1:40-1332(-)
MECKMNNSNNLLGGSPIFIYDPIQNVGSYAILAPSPIPIYSFDENDKDGLAGGWSCKAESTIPNATAALDAYQSTATNAASKASNAANKNSETSKPARAQKKMMVFKKVSLACQACRKAHACCGDERPCRRCLKFGLPCIDVVGKKRGPKFKNPVNARIAEQQREQLRLQQMQQAVLTMKEKLVVDDLNQIDDDDASPVVSKKTPSAPFTPALAPAASKPSSPDSDASSTTSPLAACDSLASSPPPLLNCADFDIDQLLAPQPHEAAVPAASSSREMAPHQQQQGPTSNSGSSSTITPQEMEEYHNKLVANLLSSLEVSAIASSFRSSRKKVGVVMCIQPPQLTTVNDAVKERWGFTPATLYDLVHPAEIGRAQELVERLYSSSTVHSETARFLALDAFDQCFELCLEASVTRDPNDNSTVLYMVVNLYF